MCAIARGQRVTTEWGGTRAARPHTQERTQRYTKSCAGLFISTTWGLHSGCFVVCGPHESDRTRRTSRQQRDNESALINTPKYSPKSPADLPRYCSERRGKKKQFERSLSVCCAVSWPEPEARQKKGTSLLD